METNNKTTNKDFFKRFKTKQHLEINEIWEIRKILNNKYQEDILILLINKMLYYNSNDELLNEFGEFYKPREEMRWDIGIAPDTITNNLKKLQKAGWLEFENKPIKNNKIRCSLHFILNSEKIEKEILETGEVNLNNKYWELRGAYTPNNISKSDKKPNPINVKKPTEKSTDELVGLNAIESIEEPTKEIEELTEPLNDNRTKTNKTKTKKEMRNEKNVEPCEEARLLTEYKDKINLKNIFHDLDLTVEIVNYLYSKEYIEGVDRKMDDKKASVDIIINQMINPLRGIPMVFN